MDSGDKLLTTDMLRGLLLIGALGLAGYVAYRFYQKMRIEEAQRAASPSKITVPVQLPGIKKKKK